MQTFVETYMGWTAKSEAPARYHLFSALTVLAHALGRRVFLNQESVKAVFPAHMMVLLVGPSGLKKTTAIKRATGLLANARQRLRGLEQTHINVMSERMSSEALWDDLVPMDDEGCRVNAEEFDCVGLLVAPEMSMTFGNASYMDGLTAAMNRLADSDVGSFDWAVEKFEPYYLPSTFKKDKGKRFLQNASIGLLLGTTPTDLGETLPLHVRGTGFLARVIPVWELVTTRPRNLMLTSARDVDDVRPWLVERLAEFARLAGMCEVEPRGVEYLEGLWGEKQAPNPDPLLAAFENRQEDHTHRIAIVLACDALLTAGARGAQKRIWLTREVYEQAWGLVQGCKAKLLDCFAPVGTKTQIGLLHRVLAVLRRRQELRPQEPGYRFYRLRNKAWAWGARTDHLRGVLAELEDLGQLTVEHKGRKDELLVLKPRKPGLHSISRPASTDRTLWDRVNGALADGGEEREDYPEDEQAEEERLNQELADEDERGEDT